MQNPNEKCVVDLENQQLQCHQINQQMKQTIIDQVKNRECSDKSYAIKYPVQFNHAKNIYLYDINGLEYIDCLNGFGVNILGHNHPVLNNAAVHFFQNDYPYQILDLCSTIRNNFINELFTSFPQDMQSNIRIQFCGSSGSDAIEASLKLARKYTNRDNIMFFSGSFHGSTLGAVSITGNEVDQFCGSQNNVIPLPFPNDDDCPFGLSNGQGTVAIINYIEKLLKNNKKGFAMPAAIILELVQSDGGIITAPLNFVKAIRKITQDHDMLLIVDEVQTGFGKTGFMFAFQKYDIRPDVVVLSKSLGAGQPLSCIVFNKKINIPVTSSTFRGNQLAMYLGTAQLQFIKQTNLLQNVNYLESYVKHKAQWLKDLHFDQIGNVRVVGLLFAIEFSYNGVYNTEFAGKVNHKCFENRLICKLGGKSNSNLIFWTCLIINQSQVDQIFDVVHRSILTVKMGLV